MLSKGCFKTVRLIAGPRTVAPSACLSFIAHNLYPTSNQTLFIHQKSPWQVAASSAQNVHCSMQHSPRNSPACACFSEEPQQPRT
jgi:hypothetical protein